MKLFNILVFALIGAASAQTPTPMWYLAATGTPTASVGDTNTQSTPEIELTYEISDEDPTFQVQVLDVTCSTPVSTSLVFPTQTSSPIGGTSRLQVTVKLDIDQTNVGSSDIYNSDSGGTLGNLDLCVRVDVLDSTGTSYNFNERQLFIDVDLTQGFDITAVSDRATATVTNADAETDFGLNICQCNEFSVCSTATITQGQVAYICIKQTANSGVMISSISQLTFTKDAQTINAIENGAPDDMTATQSITEGAGGTRIETQLPSVFFQTAGNLDADGTIVVLYGGGRSRQLRFSVGNSVGQHIGGSTSRMIQEQRNETQADFSVSMMLAPPPQSEQEPPKSEANPGVLIGGIVGGIAGVAIIVALVLAIRRKKEDDKDNDNDNDNGKEYKAGSFVCANDDKEGEATTISIDLNDTQQEDEKEICA